MLIRAIQVLNVTIIPAGITCEKILSGKSVEFGIHLKKSTIDYKQKSQIIFATIPPTSSKNYSYILFL